MITAGKYTARACGESLIGTAKTGSNFIQFYLVVTDGEFKGERVRWTGYFTENTNVRTLQSLRTCGWRGDDLGEFGDVGLHGLDANEVEIVVEMEEYKGDNEKYKGKFFPRVAWINGLSGFLNKKAAMNPAAAAAFGERMRGLVLKTKEKNPLPAAPPKPAAPARATAPASDVPEDEIPF